MVFSGMERHPILLRANVGLSPHPPALRGKAQNNGVSSREGYQLWGEQGFNSLPPAAVARTVIHGLLFSMQRRWVGRESLAPSELATKPGRTILFVKSNFSPGR